MPLKELLKARFKTALDSVPPGTWKVLITDTHSQKLLDCVYTNFEILQMNVTSVEPLQSPRGQMSVEAIYLLTPTTQNVDRVIMDWTGRRMYKAAHLFFIDGIDDGLAQKLTSSIPGDALQAFTELYCNFWALEDRIFSLKTPSAFYSLFGNPGGAAVGDLALEAFEDDVKVTGRTILNLLATLSENPHIRYYSPQHHSPLGPLANQTPGGGLGSNGPSGGLAIPPANAQGGSSLRWRSAVGENGGAGGGRGGGGGVGGQPSMEYTSRRLAMQVQSDLDEYLANNPDFPPASGRPKAMMYILDRSIDPVAPFLHEFWYQAMVNDLLSIEDGTKYRYKYTNTVGGTENKEAILDENDPVWMSVKHLHMKDAIDTLMMDFNKFAQEHAGFSAGHGQVNVGDLKDMLASLPQFQTQREQYSLHLDMAQECMSLFEKKHLNMAANVEQCCATGYTSEGKTPKTLVEEMVPLLDDKALTSVDKVRVIALYILFREGVADEDRRRLFQHARLSISEQDSINNLVFLGAKVIKDASRSSSKTPRLKQKYQQADGEYELSRYKPIVQMVMEESTANRLDSSLFPFTKVAPPELNTNSLRSRSHLSPPGANGPGSGSLRGSGGISPSASSLGSGGGSLRSARPTWHKAPSARQGMNTEGKQRLIIFVAGGVTYAEMRLAYTMGQSLGKDVYIGSTHVITPESFVRDLRSLGRGGVASNPPNAIQLHPKAPQRPARSPGRPVTYQHILNRRHWEPLVGPPPLAPPPGAPGGLQAPSLQSQNSFNSAANLNTQMGGLSLGGGNGKEKEKEKGSKLGFGRLFKKS